MSSLSAFSLNELQNELNRRKLQTAFDKSLKTRLELLSQWTPDGLWEVETEGDCEGRTTKRFGTFRGNYAELALQFGNQAMYSLVIRPAEALIPEYKPAATTATVSVHPILGFEHGQEDAEVEALNQWLDGKYNISKAQNFRSIIIKRKK